MMITFFILSIFFLYLFITDNVEAINSPLQALSKMVPVPESLMSPDFRPPVSVIGGKMSHTLQKIKTPPTRSPKLGRNVPIQNKTAQNCEGKIGNSPFSARKRTVAYNNSK